MYEKEIFRKLRWRNYTKTQWSESILINKIKRMFGKKIVIGYGSFQEKQQMKYSRPTPNIGIKRLLNRHFKVLTVDEFRTSKTCCNCKNIKKELKAEKTYECKKCKLVIDRDINASINIYDI